MYAFGGKKRTSARLVAMSANYRKRTLVLCEAGWNCV